MGQNMNVRLVGAKYLVGFRASILRTLFVPYPYLHVSYPQEISSVELRQTQRVTVRTVCAVKNETLLSAEPIPAMIVDLSIGGALVESPEPLGLIGETVAIVTRLLVAKMEWYVSLPGIIRSVQHLEKASPPLYQYGVEFQAMKPDISLILHGFVHERVAISLTGMA